LLNCEIKLASSKISAMLSAVARRNAKPPTKKMNKAVQSLGRLGGRANGTLGGRPAYGIQNTGDIKVIKFTSGTKRDAWVTEWADVRAKIGSNYIRFSEGVCRVQFGDCWDIVSFSDRTK
jgi:hypothetical protein